MRLHLDLLSLDPRPVIPVSYNHTLSRTIQKVLSAAEGEYERFSRAAGLRGQSAKRFKLYTYSGLLFHGPRWELIDGMFHFNEPLQARLIMSFPHDEEFMRGTIIPIIERAVFQLSGPDSPEPVRLKVATLEAHPIPENLGPGTYRLITPVTISRRSKEEIKYLTPKNRETGLALAENLLEKHEVLTGERLPNDAVTLRADMEYLARAPHTMKVVTIREGMPDETRLRGFIAPIKINGDPRLIRTAFACGIGERNSLGFGLLAEPSNSTRRSRAKKRATHDG
jgi:CRISPR-associated endoribonuclease Cas6